jgi:hypothetical protein
MWPTMTSIVPGMLFLLLYPLASFAGEAEQEMEAEAQKLLPQYFTKCGEDYFSKYPAFTLLSFGTKEQPKTYVIEQYKDLTVQAVLQPLSKADSLNGPEWKALAQFNAPVTREFKEMAGKPPKFAWSEWKDAVGGFAVFSVRLEKKQGHITMHKGLSRERSAIECTAIPR